MALIKKPKPKPVIEKHPLTVDVDPELITALSQYKDATQSWLAIQPDGTEIESIDLALEKKIKEVLMKFAREFQKETGELYPAGLQQFLESNKKPKRLTPTEKKLLQLEEKEKEIEKIIGELTLASPTASLNKKLESKRNALSRVKQQLLKMQPTPPPLPTQTAVDTTTPVLEKTQKPNYFKNS